MITISDDIKIMVCTQPIDMRKQINGLILLVIESLKQNPQSKQMFLFFGKSKDKVKAILWDNNGFILLYKKLEKEKFIFPQHIHKPIEVNNDLFQALIRGFDFYRLKQHPELNISQYF
jgi:transposase